jgi:hypothetical protein
MGLRLSGARAEGFIYQIPKRFRQGLQIPNNNRIMTSQAHQKVAENTFRWAIFFVKAGKN